MIIVDPQSGTQVWGQGYKNLKSVFWGEMFSWKVTNYINYLKDNLLVIKLEVWCRRGETTSPTDTEPNTPYYLWKHSPHTFYRLYPILKV